MAPRLTVGSFKIEPRRNLVTDPEGVEVRIKPRSMQLLLHLSSSPGRVIPREEILDAVWDGRAVGDEVLTVAVAELRRAFGDDPKDPRYIQTLPGKGYSLVAPVASSFRPGTAGKRRSVVRFAALAVAVAGIVSWLARRGGDDITTEGEVAYRLDLTVPDSAPVSISVSRPFAISPDGTRIVYLTGASTYDFELRLRDMDDPVPRRIAGTEGGFDPFFSPDGEWIGFLAEDSRRLYRAPVGGGQRIPVTDVSAAIGASWPLEDVIFFTAGPGTRNDATRGGLYRVSVSSGERELLTRPGENERAHRFPELLPDGKTLLFTRRTVEEGIVDRLVARRLDTEEEHVVVENASFGRYAASGHFVFFRDGKLMAAAFDRERAALLSAPVVVVDDVDFSPSGAAKFDLSDNGNLVIAHSSSRERALVWVDRSGNETTVLTRGRISTPRISPDGTRVAYGKGADVFLYDLERSVESRVSFDAGPDIPSLCWMPDGRFLTYTSGFGGRNAIYLLDTMEEHEPRFLLRDEGALLILGSWSADGRTLLFMKSQPNEFRPDLWTLSIEEETPRVYQASPFSEVAPELSPDGRWAAFVSDESGRYEVYVRSFPEGGPKIPVSRSGGVGARWSPDGTRLWFWNQDELFEVAMTQEEELRPGEPERLFEGDYPHLDSIRARSFDYSERHDAFLFLRPSGHETRALSVTVGWLSELERLVPVPSR